MTSVQNYAWKSTCRLLSKVHNQRFVSRATLPQASEPLHVPDFVCSRQAPEFGCMLSLFSLRQTAICQEVETHPIKLALKTKDVLRHLILIPRRVNVEVETDERF